MSVATETAVAVEVVNHNRTGMNAIEKKEKY